MAGIAARGGALDRVDRTRDRPRTVDGRVLGQQARPHVAARAAPPREGGLTREQLEPLVRGRPLDPRDRGGARRQRARPCATGSTKHGLQTAAAPLLLPRRAEAAVNRSRVQPSTAGRRSCASGDGALSAVARCNSESVADAAAAGSRRSSSGRPAARCLRLRLRRVRRRAAVPPRRSRQRSAFQVSRRGRHAIAPERYVRRRASACYCARTATRWSRRELASSAAGTCRSSGQYRYN